jgi:hypothetical protein
MRGPDVKIAQQQLARRGFMSQSSVDGMFGPVTANAAKRAKWVLGYPAADLKPIYGSLLHGYLTGSRKQTMAMRNRAKNRAKRRPEIQSIGAKAADRMVRWYLQSYRESPAGSNRVPELARLAKQTGLSSWYQQMGWPWCGFAVFLAALAEGSSSAKLGLRQGRFNALYTPEIRAVSARGAFGLGAVAPRNARKGTGLLFDFGGGNGGEVDHVGYALGRVGEDVKVGDRVFSAGPGEIVAVEGNTSYDANGSQANGGAVAVRVRPISQVRAAYVLS